MHSRIFQLSINSVKEEDFIGEEVFYDNGFVGQIADYVSEDTNREEDILWFLDFVGDYGIQYDEEEKSIIFLEGFKRNYFREKFEEFNQIVKEIDLDKFINSREIYQLEQLITDKYGFYVFMDYAQTLDDFVRYNLEENVKYYFGNTFDYHF